MDAMRILLLEDDRDTRDYLARGLKELGHCVVAESDGKATLARTLSEAFDILILDRMVPGLDGLTMLRLAREAGCQAPAIILSAMAGIEDRVAGLEGGADDYLIKPFAFAELTARLGALARRPPPGDRGDFQALLRVADIEMDLLRRTVRRGDRPVELQPREFSLLEFLLRNPDRPVTRTMLLEKVWNYHFDPQTNVIDVHISRLRAKIDKEFEQQLLQTVRGAGYCLQA